MTTSTQPDLLDLAYHFDTQLEFAGYVEIKVSEFLVIRVSDDYPDGFYGGVYPLDEDFQDDGTGPLDEWSFANATFAEVLKFVIETKKSL